jgi:GT2 family glycosyltransferase
MRATAQDGRDDGELKGWASTRSAPIVSVVIVTYESEEDIVGCLRSVRRCALPLEVIVIDNASSDATVKRVRMHPALADWLTCNADNVGFAKAVNQGIQRARGEYVLLLNPDTVLQANAIERAVDALNMHADAAVAGCLLLNPDGTEQPGGRRAVPTPARALMRILALHRIFPGQRWARGFVLSDDPLPGHTVDVEATSGAFMLVRRAAIDKIGVLDEGYFMHCEDLDWCMRFRAGGWRVLFVPGARILHKKGQSGRHRRVRVEWHKHRGMIRFYRKFFLSRYPVLLMPAIVSAVWVRFAIKAAMLTAASIRPAVPRAHAPADAVRSPRTVPGRAAVGRYESRRY